MIDFEKMQAKANLYGVQLSSVQLSQLDKYADLLVEWNTKMNLTGITDSEGIMTRHFEDSIALLKYVDVDSRSKVIDVGTGAGFPGMVLKIIRPDLDMTLLDSLNKRIIFLNDVAEKIGVKVKTVHLRAEEGGQMPEFREKYDIACARAVNAAVLAVATGRFGVEELGKYQPDFILPDLRDHDAFFKILGISPVSR